MYEECSEGLLGELTVWGVVFVLRGKEEGYTHGGIRVQLVFASINLGLLQELSQGIPTMTESDVHEASTFICESILRQASNGQEMGSSKGQSKEDITNLQVTIKGSGAAPCDGSLFSVKLLLGKDVLLPHPRATS
ncbi:hypothetical protein ACRRTK_004292 [Alexandromys fortis]